MMVALPEKHGVFGFPAKELAPVASGAIQYSPLVPGAESLEDVEPGSLASMVMAAPPGTIERRYAMALALRALAPGMPITVLAPKDKGGSRIAKELVSFGCEVTEDSKSHHRICTSLNPTTDQGALAMADALAEGAPRKVEALGLWSQPGVFSWDRIDQGSALLVEQLPALVGRGADLGCGIGYLSLAILKSRKVTHLTLVDIDRRAIAAAEKNIGPARANFLCADLRVADTKLKGLDFVVTNPPFHDGGIEDQSLGATFIQQTAAMLRPGGTGWIVANRHLPYEAVIKPIFSEFRLVQEGGGFKIFEVKR